MVIGRLNRTSGVLSKKECWNQIAVLCGRIKLDSHSQFHLVRSEQGVHTGFIRRNTSIICSSVTRPGLIISLDNRYPLFAVSLFERWAGNEWVSPLSLSLMSMSSVRGSSLPYVRLLGIRAIDLGPSSSDSIQSTDLTLRLTLSLI